MVSYRLDWEDDLHLGVILSRTLTMCHGKAQPWHCTGIWFGAFFIEI